MAAHTIRSRHLLPSTARRRPRRLPQQLAVGEPASRSGQDHADVTDTFTGTLDQGATSVQNFTITNTGSALVKITDLQPLPTMQVGVRSAPWTPPRRRPAP